MAEEAKKKISGIEAALTALASLVTTRRTSGRVAPGVVEEGQKSNSRESHRRASRTIGVIGGEGEEAIGSARCVQGGTGRTIMSVGRSEGWQQHEVASRTDEVFGERMFARMADSVVGAVRSWCGEGRGGQEVVWLFHVAPPPDHEAGSPSLPCDPPPPSPLSLSLHRAFLQGVPPTRLYGPPPSSARKGGFRGKKGWALQRRNSHLP